jgi:hypothetical protein
METANICFWRKCMSNQNTPVKTNDDAQSGTQKGIEKQNKKKLVDVATLEKSDATSVTDSQSENPVAVGEASS